MWCIVQMARMLAAKTSLLVRKDALGEEEGDAELGIEVRAKLERRIKSLEEAHVCINNNDDNKIKNDNL